MPCSPQAAVSPATATEATAVSRTLAGRFMRAEIIRKWPPLATGDHPSACRHYDRPMPVPRLVTLALLLASVASATLTSGCSQATRVAAGQTISVTVTEYRIRPNDIIAPSG